MRGVDRLISAMEDGALIIESINEGRRVRKVIDAGYHPRQSTIDKAISEGRLRPVSDGLFPGETQTYAVVPQTASGEEAA